MRRDGSTTSVCTWRPSSRNSMRRARWNADSSRPRVATIGWAPVFTIVHAASAPIHRHDQLRIVLARKEPGHRRGIDRRRSRRDREHLSIVEARGDTQSVRRRVIGEPLSVGGVAPDEQMRVARAPQASAARFGSVQSLDRAAQQRHAIARQPLNRCGLLIERRAVEDPHATGLLRHPAVRRRRAARRATAPTARRRTRRRRAPRARGTRSARAWCPARRR